MLLLYPGELYRLLGASGISRGITLHTVVGHFQLWNFFVDLEMLNIFAV
jgi:hypothetical protein